MSFNIVVAHAAADRHPLARSDRHGEPAGPRRFPSPADDFIEEMIDLNHMLVKKPIATFMWRLAGDCMIDAKIFPGDVVVVDRSLSPKHRSIVLAIIDGDRIPLR